MTGTQESVVTLFHHASQMGTYRRDGSYTFMIAVYKNPLLTKVCITVNREAAQVSYPDHPASPEPWRYHLSEETHSHKAAGGNSQPCRQISQEFSAGDGLEYSIHDL